MTSSNLTNKLSKLISTNVLFIVSSFLIGVAAVLFSLHILFGVDLGWPQLEHFLSRLSAVLMLGFASGILASSLKTTLKEHKTDQKPQMIKEEKAKTSVSSQEPQKVQHEFSSYAYDDLLSLKRRDVVNTFQTTETRLREEIENQKNRAKINLIIGVIIIIIGISILILFILDGKKDLLEIKDSISLMRLTLYWVSKLTLVALIEVFAHFYLRLYKDNISTIKYYHNELTNIESRKIALLFSVLHGGTEDTSHTLSTLGGIDRNFVLPNNHTTVELEKMKIENSSMKDQMEHLWNLLKQMVPNNPEE